MLGITEWYPCCQSVNKTQGTFFLIWTGRTHNDSTTPILIAFVEVLKVRLCLGYPSVPSRSFLPSRSARLQSTRVMRIRQNTPRGTRGALQLYIARERDEP